MVIFFEKNNKKKKNRGEEREEDLMTYSLTIKSSVVSLYCLTPFSLCTWLFL